MSEAHQGDTPISTSVLDGAIGPYPRNRLYLKVAILLGIITIAEIMTHVTPEFFGGMGSPAFITALLVMMFVKFWIVAYFFMHLRWDNRILTWVFYTGFALAGTVYTGLMLMLHVFSQG